MSKEQGDVEKSKPTGVAETPDKTASNPNSLNSVSVNKSTPSVEQTEISDQNKSQQASSHTLISDQENTLEDNLWVNLAKHYKGENNTTGVLTTLTHGERKSKIAVIMVFLAVLVILLICLWLFRAGEDKDQTCSQVPDKEDVQVIEEVDEPKMLVGETNGHEWVDLGLPSGLRWATVNVGASSPEQYGDYFAWGETRPKTSYSEKSCITSSKNLAELIAADITNSEGNLNPSHDAATANWGEAWRMPTLPEIQELLDNTTWEVATQDGVPGRLIKSNLFQTRIFIPAAGFMDQKELRFEGERGYYWTSSYNENNSNCSNFLFFYPDQYNSGWLNRYNGRTVRAVTD